MGLLPKLAFSPLSKISRLYLCGSISELSVLSHWSLCLFFHQYHATWLLSLYGKPWSLFSNMSLPTLFLSFSTALAVLGILPFHINLWTCFHYLKNRLLVFGLRLHWTSRSVEKNWHLNDIEPKNAGAWTISPFIWSFFEFFHQIFIVFHI